MRYRLYDNTVIKCIGRLTLITLLWVSIVSANDDFRKSIPHLQFDDVPSTKEQLYNDEDTLTHSNIDGLSLHDQHTPQWDLTSATHENDHQSIRSMFEKDSFFQTMGFSGESEDESDDTSSLSSSTGSILASSSTASIIHSSSSNEDTDIQSRNAALSPEQIVAVSSAAGLVVTCIGLWQWRRRRLAAVAGPAPISAILEPVAPVVVTAPRSTFVNMISASPKPIHITCDHPDIHH